MKHRYHALSTKFALRSEWLPEQCLLILLNCRDGPTSNVTYTRLNQLLRIQPVYLDVARPVPSSNLLKSWLSDQRQEIFNKQMDTAKTTGKSVLLRACRPSVSKPDPILYLPMARTARSRLVRWRLGRFANMDQECPCFSGARISRDHLASDCRAIPQDLLYQLPAPPPDVNRIDHALNTLSTNSKTNPPSFWPALLEVLYLIDVLCHPLATIAPDPDPGDAWYAPNPAS